MSEMCKSCYFVKNVYGFFIQICELDDERCDYDIGGMHKCKKYEEMITDEIKENI